MEKLIFFASLTSAVLICETAFADGTATSAPANTAPPISTIATFEGEYACIYHDRIYSVGSEICIGKQALQCQAGHFGGANQPPVAATWAEKGGDFCAAGTVPIPQ